MLHIVLYQPEIPPNTGNIIRLCANSGCQLHLIGPMGFELENKQLRRAGLDYHEFANIKYHESVQDFFAQQNFHKLYAFSTKGVLDHTTPCYQDNDALLFGPETRGLPQSVLGTLPRAQVIRIPMVATSRSLNLSNAVAIGLYEAWRQQQFR